MAQVADYVIANANGATVRADINAVFLAVSSTNSGTSEPSTMYAYMLWVDTTTSLLKLRNAANGAWITLGLSVTASNTVDINGGAIDGTAIGAASASTGAFTSITGSLASTITTADNTDTLSLISTDADANSGPNLRLYRNSGSPADDDYVGDIQFEGRNDNSQDVVYGQIHSRILDASDGTEDGMIGFRTMLAGTSRNRLEFTPTETVINDDSQDLDFRIESDTKTHAFSLDGGTGSVGFNVADGDVTSDGTLARTYVGIIGTGNRGRLNIGSTAVNGADGGTISFVNGANQLGALYMDTNAGVQNAGKMFMTSTESITINATAGSEVVFNDGSADVDFRVESNGNANMIFVDGGNDVVGIGTNAPLFTFSVQDADGVTQGGVGNNALYVRRAQSGAHQCKLVIDKAGGTLASPTAVAAGEISGQVMFRSYNDGYREIAGIKSYAASGFASSGADTPGFLTFVTSPDGSSTPSERMRIDSDGTLLVASTSKLNACRISGGNSPTVPFIETQNSTTGATNYFAVFRANNTNEIGFINITNTGTTYDTGSDYRLKENIRPLENGIERLNQLNPIKFDWKADGTSSEGFLAHEASEVFPEAVSGEKDGEHMQGMDYGRITPLLVKAIQEQQEQIEELTEKVTALENA